MADFDARESLATKAAELRTRKLIGTLTGLAAIVGGIIFLAFVIITNGIYRDYGSLNINYLGLSIGLVVLGSGAIIYSRASTQIRLEALSAQSYESEVQATIASVDTTEPTMKNLLALNRQEMSQYHDITKRQAHRSFNNSQIAMWAGLIVLVASLFVIVVPGLVPGDTKLTVAALGTVGTVVSGYITRTFLKQHTISLQQLNSFFNQPLVSSYLLTAERVAGQLEGEERTKALNDVVAQALSAAASDDAAAQIAKESKR